jgi:hypothetical protein
MLGTDKLPRPPKVLFNEDCKDPGANDSGDDNESKLGIPGSPVAILGNPCKETDGRAGILPRLGIPMPDRLGTEGKLAKEGNPNDPPDKPDVRLPTEGKPDVRLPTEGKPDVRLPISGRPAALKLLVSLVVALVTDFCKSAS